MMGEKELHEFSQRLKRELNHEIGTAAGCIDSHDLAVMLEELAGYRRAVYQAVVSLNSIQNRAEHERFALSVRPK